MNRLVEFFEGERNRLSMMRLMVFASFFPSTYVLCCIRTTEALAVYVGTYVGGALGGKAADVIGRKRGQNVIPIKSSKKS